MNFNDYNQNYSQQGGNGYYFENNENTKENIEDAYKKYSNYSKDALYKEFIEETARQKASGALSPQKIEQIKSVIFPYLTEKERETFNSIINGIM